MTEAERKLAFELISPGLPRGLFLERFRNSSDGRKLALTLLEEAVESRVPDDVECALLVGFTFGFTTDHLNVLVRLMDEDWHVRHEDVVTALGTLRDERALPALSRAARYLPAYLEYDESRALAVKAIWAIGQVPGREALATLRELAGSNEEIVRSEVAKQLELRKAST